MEHIALPEGNTRRRWIAVILFLLIGLAAFGVGIHQMVSHSAGWTEIKARTGSPGCAAEFSFQYCLDEKDSTAQFRALTALYTAACERATKVYSSADAYEEIGNLFTVNTHPNEIVTVEPELYRALSAVQTYQNRVPYLAPLYESYGSLFYCTGDEETASYDPLQNEELAAWFGELAAYTGDPAQIDLTLLGDNQVRLTVSEAYLQYAKENAIEHFVDLGWMKNAFILDDLTDMLRDQGFTHGYLQSVDGFGCNLNRTGESYVMDIFDRQASGAGLVAQMQYARPLSYAVFRSYSVNPTWGDWYYELSDGAVRSIFVDPTDGRPKTAIDDLLLWSDTLGCGELTLRACPVFLADEFDPAALDVTDLFFAYCRGQTLVCNDPDVTFPVLAEGYAVRR